MAHEGSRWEMTGRENGLRRLFRIDETDKVVCAPPENLDSVPYITGCQ